MRPISNASWAEPVPAGRGGVHWAYKMVARENSPLSDNGGEHRVIGFRGRPGARPPVKEPAPVEDLAKYEQSREAPEDYRHRMIVNAAAFLFVVTLIGVAIWLADTMADMRRNQDCVLSGRRGCTPVEVGKDRW